MTASVGYLLARRGGRPGSRLALALDLTASLGTGEMLRRRGEERELARLYPGPRVNRRIWQEAADEVGATLREAGEGELTVEREGARVAIRLHVTPIDSPKALALALDKAATQRLLIETGVPVPEQVRFAVADLEPARRALAAGGSWVVKPAGGTSSGRGTTTGVGDEAALRRAAVRASRSGPDLLLEGQVPGEEYRLLLLDGELIGAVRRHPPTVTGNGRSTIAELIHAENRHRLDADGMAGLTLITLDLDALLALERAGLSPRSVPVAGQRVAVKGSRSQAGAADAETVALAAVGDGLRAEVAAAARALGLRLAGIDLATPDLGRSLADAGGAVIEVNGTPGLHYHYLVRDPADAQRVAIPILERLLQP